MPPQPVKAVVEYIPTCRLAQTLSGVPGISIHVKQVHVTNNRINAWVKFRGTKDMIRQSLKRLSKISGATYTPVNGGLNTRLVQISLPSHFCHTNTSGCLLRSPEEKIHVISALLRKNRLYLLIVAPTIKTLEKLENRGYRIVKILGNSEPNHLTDDQEKILYKAYKMGYYEYPKRATLKDLAREMGVSVSTIAESIRRIEKKVIERMISEDILLSQIVSNEQDA